ncbi:unnamed protein product [Lampetra planeri]
MSSLWIGDLDPAMDQSFVARAFASVGENVTGVKIIRNRLTGAPAGYGFVEFLDQSTAERCLHSLNGQPIPGAAHVSSGCPHRHSTRPLYYTDAHYTSQLHLSTTSCLAIQSPYDVEDATAASC